MERWSKYIFIGFIVLAACSSTPEELPQINDNNLIHNTWIYDFITVDGSDTEYRFANSRMELTTNRATAGGNRGDLFRRQIVYYSNGTYQLKWAERGDYTLGTDGEQNWQPSFGSWELTGDRLVHNPGHYYEQVYIISLSQNTLSRTTDRQMLEANQGASWLPGEIVTQTEYFNVLK